jgi:hypothetical protein
MSTATIVAVTLLIVCLGLIYIMGRARTLGPLVLVGVFLGVAVGISGTALVGGLT